MDDEWKSKVYATHSIDGGVSIVVPSNDYEGDRDEWIECVELDTVYWIDLYPIQLPGDRYFREAWRLVDNSIEICLEHAKEIHINNLRKVRDKRLKELDVEIVVAQEREDRDLVLDIILLRDKLRMMPEDEAFNVDDVDSLRRVFPSYLHID